jgi:hypothetical protein
MYRIIFLLLITSASFGQVLQETNGSRADNRNVFKLGFRLPQVCWVTGNPNLLNYSAFMSKGAMVYDTCAGKIKRWSGSAWISIQDSTAGGGGGVTTVGAFQSGSTANAASISGSNIYMHKVSATNPGILSTGTDTIAGNKNFNGIIGQGVATGAKQYYIDAGAGSRVGVGINTSEFQQFVLTGNRFTWNTGGDLQATGVNEWMRLSSAGLVLSVPFSPSTLNVSLISQPATLTAKQYYYDGGAGARIGAGVNTSEFQQFVPASNRFTWNTGGDLQTSGTNELMRLSSAGLVVSAVSLVPTLISQPATLAAKQYYYDGGAASRIGVGINTSEMQSFTVTGTRFTWNGGGDRQATGTNEWMRLTATNLAVGTTSPNASAKLDVASTTQGFLPPRMNAGNRNAIASPASSLVVANTSLQNGLNFYNGTAWVGTNQQVGNEAITANKTITATTGTHLHMIDATSGNVTITLPTMAAGYLGVEYQFIRTDGSANTVTIQRAASNTINNAATSFTIAQFERAYVIGVNNSNTFTWHAGKFTNY